MEGVVAQPSGGHSQKELQKFKGEAINIETAFGDADSTNFGDALAEAISRSG